MVTILQLLLISLLACAVEIRRIPLTSTPPTIRHQFTTAFDSKSETIVLYGGFSRDAEFNSDFWVFYIKSELWMLLTPISSLLPGNC